MTAPHDVVVVGAGVAGSATALHLAQRGRRVVLIDRGAYPREKVCGEGLMPHGVGELTGLGLCQEVEAAGARRFQGIAYHVAGRTAVGRFPTGHGLGVRRWALDAALLGRCQASDRIEVRLGARVTGLTVGAEGVSVAVGDGEVAARAVVGADGRGSAVRRYRGLDVKVTAAPRYGLRAHYKLARGQERPYVDVFVADDCELYITPTGPGQINVAVLCGRDLTRRIGGDLEAGFESVVRAHPEVGAMLQGAVRLTPPTLCGPLRRAARDVVADRTLLVGDAAGFVDAITGEGMSVALVCARLAAEVLDAALDEDRLTASGLRPYARRRRASTIDQIRLTEILLWGLRNRTLAAHVVGNLARHPDAFGKVLAVNSGERSLVGLGLTTIARIVGR